MTRPTAEVLVCRGCCCGTERKHPGTDHDAQLCALRAAAATSASVRAREVDCLGPCQHSNVMVLRPVGAVDPEPIWLGGIVTETQTRSLADWITAGGDLTAVPPELLMSRFDAPTADRRRAAG